MNGTINYTIEEITRITKGKLINLNRDLPKPTQVSLDSRKIISPATTLFIAIKTSSHDGNDFIEHLYERGVRNFISTNKHLDVNRVSLANVLLVDNAITCLQRLAAFHRTQFAGLPVIGITGSNGKTVVKEWLNQLLEPDYSIVRSPRSYNSQIGVPLSVLEINEANNLAIFEAGISQPGEMAKLEKVIQPSVGVFTNIGEAHDEGFKSRAEKIAEKLQLFVHATQLVFCSDDVSIKKSSGSFSKKNKR